MGCLVIRQFTAIILFVASFWEPASASTYALRRAVDEAFQLDAAGYTLEARRGLASAQEKYWTDFLQKFPELSQEEQVKIAEDINSSDNSKHAEARASRNGLLFVSRNTLDSCKIASTELLPTIGKEPKNESIAWIKLIKCFDNARGLPYLLKEAGITERIDYTKPYDMQSISMWSSQSASVVERLLADWP